MPLHGGDAEALPRLVRLAARGSDRAGLTQNAVAVTFVLLFLSSWATELIGIHALFGAFLAGVVMPSNSRLRCFLRERSASWISWSRRSCSVAIDFSIAAWRDATSELSFRYIAIRTAQFSNGVARVQGGGGITARSQPAAEYEESLTKIRRIMEAFRP